MALSTSGTQWIENLTSPVTNYPITVGCWVRPAAAGNVFRSIWQLSAADDATNRLALYQWTGSVWCTLATVAGSDATCTGGTVTATSWHFLIARFISTTNRRIDVLNASGSRVHAQNTTSAAPASLVELNIAADTSGSDAFSGLIGELWYTNTDIQPDGAALQDGTLWQLAYGGPFSMPHIAADIVEYRSFRKHPYRDELGEVHYGATGRQTWAPNSTPAIGFDPPLPYWYVKPGQNKHVLMI